MREGRGSRREGGGRRREEAGGLFSLGIYESEKMLTEGGEEGGGEEGG